MRNYREQICCCHSDFGFLVSSSLEKPVNEKRSNSNCENQRTTDFGNQNLQDALLALMCGENFIIKYT